MKPFPFESIRAHKGDLVDQERLKLTILYREEQGFLDQIDQLTQNRVDIQKQIAKLYDQNLNINLLRLYQDQLRYLKSELDGTHQKLGEKRQEIKDQKDQVFNSNLDYEKFNQMKELYIKKNTDEIIRKEKLELDEIVTIQYSRGEHR